MTINLAYLGRTRRSATCLMAAALLVGSLAETKAQETLGGGTVATPAVGPAPSYGIGGPGMVLVKNWHFGTNGTIKNYDDMSANFFYHDQFGTIGNGSNYGAVTVSHDAANALNNQPIEGSDCPPVRAFTADSMKTFLVPLDGATKVDPNKHNAGNGSFMAKFKLPNGGSLLGRDIVWETRVRYVTPPYFWFAIWTAGNKWKWDNGAAGAENDLVESFGYDNGDGADFKNFDGRYWHSGSVSQPPKDKIGYGDWGKTMASFGITKYDASQYHTWTYYYRKDNSYAMYVDGIMIEYGSDFHWTFGSKPTDEPIDMDFLFDAGWGHTQIGSVDKPLPSSAFDGKFYEWNYSRVYLSGDKGPVDMPFKGPHALPGTVKASDYNTGGASVGYYYYPTTGSTSNAYRPKDTVALEACSDTGGGYDVTGAKPNQFLRYTVNLAKAGTYNIEFRVAAVSPGGRFHVEDAKGNDVSGVIPVPATGGPQKWATVTGTASLTTTGAQILTVVQDAPGFNLNWFRFGSSIAAGLMPDGVYKIVGPKDNQGLDVNNWHTENGSGVGLYNYLAQVNQLWNFHYLGNNAYEIFGVQSGRALTATDAGVVISDYVGQPNQQWTVVPSGTNQYKLKNAGSGKLYGFDAKNNLAMSADGAQPNQVWTIALVQ